MDRNQELVLDFHERFGATVGTHPELRETELRAKLILEEAVETVAAMGFYVGATIFEPYGPEENQPDPIAGFWKQYDRPDFNEVIDGLADTLYVVLGAAVTFGIDLQPFFEEVHRSNMAKIGGTTRADGKVLKPEGWTPPDIDRILLHQQLDAEVWRQLAEEALAEPNVEVINAAEARHERLDNGEAVA